MKPTPAPDDDPSFVGLVASIIESVVAEAAPELVAIVRIDNWFDSKWLGFSGKTLGAVAVWGTELTIPPFHPHRVKSETVYQRNDEGAYDRIDAPPLHVLQPSGENLNRKIKHKTPFGVFAWWTGNTAANGRGSLMVYTRLDGQSESWFLGFEKREAWRIIRRVNIAESVIQRYLVRAGR